jgi:hypothetical protein
MSKDSVRRIDRETTSVNSTLTPWSVALHRGSSVLPVLVLCACAQAALDDVELSFGFTYAQQDRSATTSYDFSEGLAASNFAGKTDDASPLPSYVTGCKWQYIDKLGAVVGKQICDACILSWKALTAVNVADAAAGGYCEEGSGVLSKPFRRSGYSPQQRDKVVFVRSWKYRNADGSSDRF